MKPRELLDILAVAERLKDTPRHCYTSKGRRESVAEHSWMITLMAFLLRQEFPEADMDKVMAMCVIHDLGEAFTGDIPVFQKTTAHRDAEDAALQSWVASLPVADTMAALYAEMNEQKTVEARIYKSLDKLEALLQHNLSDLNTWLPNEYDLQKTYAHDTVAFSDYLKALRQEILDDTLRKIGEA